MMYGNDRDEQTICALSTPPGRGGIAVVRVSGPRAYKIAGQLASFLPEKPESHRIYFGPLVWPSRSDQPIDEVLISCFAQGRSYTGDETVEISCHGNPQIVSDIIKALCEAGATTAGPGEFTYRAFINGKIDLLQAEGVLGLIEGQTSVQRKVALRNLRGDLSRQVKGIEDRLVMILAQLEASIDFIEEDLETYDVQALLTESRKAATELEDLARSFESGRLVTEGVEVALIGPPNAGKSSLLNSLLKEERAIVTDEAGTTRDIITAELSVGGVVVRFSDTAGLRETESVVEKLGILRSKEKAQDADLVIYVFDSTLGIAETEHEILRELSQSKTIFLAANKSDQLTDGAESDLRARFQSLSGVHVEALLVGSCFDGSLAASVLDHLENRFKSKIDSDLSLVTSARQFESLNKALRSLEVASGLLGDGMSIDIVSAEYKASLLATQELAGKVYGDDILDKIFKEFCIGK